MGPLITISSPTLRVIKARFCERMSEISHQHLISVAELQTLEAGFVANSCPEECDPASLSLYELVVYSPYIFPY